MIRIPVIGVALEENGVTHMFEARYVMLEFIAVFKAGYPDINTLKNF